MYRKMWCEKQEKTLNTKCAYGFVNRTLLTGNGCLVSDESLVPSFADAAQSCKERGISLVKKIIHPHLRSNTISTN